MNQRRISFFLPLLVATLVGAGTWQWLSNKSNANSREMTCLSAVVPSVVLHHDQEQIVQLLQSLAEETNEAVPENLKSTPVQPVFSKRVDEELLNIARLFQLRGDDAVMEKSDVMNSAGKALEYFRSDAPTYLEGCLQRLKEAETDCGNIEDPNDQEKLCLEKHSEGINRWAQKFLPDAG